MEENVDSGDIFNLNNDSFVNNNVKPKSVFYQPSADEGREGVYKAVIRFLPYHKNPSKSKIQKYYVWIKDTVSGESFSADCPSTVGKKSILKDMYWKLKNSQSASEQALAENFSRAENFYSLVQVVKDPNKPELEGKIMVFKYGKKINDKIEAQLKPVDAEIPACNPFDLFEGKLFALHITKKQKWNNYDSCEFVGDKIALKLPGEDAPIKKDKKDMDRVLNWLKEGSPELDKYEYKDWTDELTNKIHNAIKNIVPDGRLVEQILATAHSDRPSSGHVAVTDVHKPKDHKGSMDEVASIAKKEVHSSTKTEKAGSTDMNDLYDNL
jgi:hypothetical protein